MTYRDTQSDAHEQANRGGEGKEKEGKGLQKGGMRKMRDERERGRGEGGEWRERETDKQTDRQRDTADGITFSAAEVMAVNVVILRGGGAGLFPVTNCLALAGLPAVSVCVCV